MSLTAGSGYSVSRSTGVCAASGRPLSAGDKCVAVLVEVSGASGEEMRRLDYSIDSWDSGARPTVIGDRPCRVFATWRTAVATGEPKGKVVFDDAELMDLFEQLDGQSDPKKQSFRYVLALLLIRRRVLRYEGQRGDEMRLRRAGPKALEQASDVIRVIDPKMDESAIEAAVEQIGALVGVTGSAGAGEAS